MIIYPAIDLIGGEAVRLLRGDYENKTVYSADPAGVAAKFAEAGGHPLFHSVSSLGFRGLYFPGELIRTASLRLK